MMQFTKQLTFKDGHKVIVKAFGGRTFRGWEGKLYYEGELKAKKIVRELISLTEAFEKIAVHFIKENIKP